MLKHECPSHVISILTAPLTQRGGANASPRHVCVRLNDKRLLLCAETLHEIPATGQRCRYKSDLQRFAGKERGKADGQHRLCRCCAWQPDGEPGKAQRIK